MHTHISNIIRVKMTVMIYCDCVLLQIVYIKNKNHISTYYIQNLIYSLSYKVALFY